MFMRAYYLDKPLTDEDLNFVSEAMQSKIEQVRIPCVLPVCDPKKGYSDRPLIDDEFLLKHLRAAGINKDYGKQVILIIPEDLHWYTALSHAIDRLTGYFPYLIQTGGHRQALDNPGSIRILDMEGLMGRKDEQ